MTRLMKKAGWIVAGVLALMVLAALWVASPVGGSVLPPVQRALHIAGVQSPAVPRAINFQGRLTDSGGLPLTGTYSVAFSVFTVPAGGSPLWTETQPTVAVASGLFSVQLGSVTAFPPDLFAEEPRYLEVQVGADPPMTPRQRFASVPYAFQADVAGTTDLLGYSLTAVDSAGSVGGFTSITVGTDGLPLVSYSDGTNGDLKVGHCGNTACTAGNTLTTVDSGGSVGQYTSVTVGTDGLPVISYYDVTNLDLKVAHCGNAACTAGNTLTAVDSAGSVGQHTSVTVGADGLPLVSYYDVTNLDLKVAHCGNAACSAGNTLTAVDSAGDVGQSTSVSVGADGLPVVSYYDVTNGNLKVAHCGNAACTAGNTLTTVDSVGNASTYTSVTVGTDGLPVVSYYDVTLLTNRDLKVAHCGNAACTASNTLTSVDTVNDVGLFSSVTIGADGLPVVSYFDDSNDNLKVAHCSNAACSAGNFIITTVDSDAGATGAYSAVTVGVDGLPLVSYYDGTNGNLKVAHCSNRFCTPNHRPR